VALHQKIDKILRTLTAPCRHSKRTPDKLEANPFLAIMHPSSAKPTSPQFLFSKMNQCFYPGQKKVQANISLPPPVEGPGARAGASVTTEEMPSVGVLGSKPRRSSTRTANGYCPCDPRRRGGGLLL